MIASAFIVARRNGWMVGSIVGLDSCRSCSVEPLYEKAPGYKTHSSCIFNLCMYAFFDILGLYMIKYCPIVG